MEGPPKRPVVHGKRVFSANDTRDPASRIMAHALWITHHGSGARAVVSVAACGSTVVASCDRLRRFLRPGGLGRVLVKWVIELLSLWEVSIYTDNHLFGHKAEAKIFIFPAMFKNRFLKCFKFVLAPMLITNVFIEHYHRSRNNLFG
jgi:hypothetical protein